MPILTLLAAIGIILIAGILIRIFLRPHNGRVTTGEIGMIGLIGRTETDLSPDGKVFVRGELWRARGVIGLPAGTDVRVIGVAGLTLEVEPLHRDSIMIEYPPRSIVDQNSDQNLNQEGEGHG